MGVGCHCFFLLRNTYAATNDPSRKSNRNFTHTADKLHYELKENLKQFRTDTSNTAGCVCWMSQLLEVRDNGLKRKKHGQITPMSTPALLLYYVYMYAFFMFNIYIYNVAYRIGWHINTKYMILMCETLGTIGVKR